MTTEDLLKPRYKVIADYPHNPYKVGELIEQFTKTAFKLTETYPHSDIEQCQVNTYPESAVISYPHLFKKLEWWEDRKKMEMPEYVKLDPIHYDDYDGLNKEAIFKVFAWDEGFAYLNPKNDEDFIDNTNLHFIPATAEEYNQYLKTKQQ